MIYGIVVKKTNKKGFVVISSSKKKLNEIQREEEKKGYRVEKWYRGYTTMRLSGEEPDIYPLGDPDPCGAALL